MDAAREAGDGRVMVITGASSGIGAATARMAVAKGYRVVLAARSREALGQLADELGGEAHALAVPCDVTSFAAQEELVKRAIDNFGGLDVAFANAGFGAARGFLNATPEHWREMVLTNVLGVAYTIRATLPALRAGSGHLLVTGSIAGRRPLPGSVYSATKAAVRSLAESARLELQGTGARVTLIEPGVVDTPFFDNPQADGLQPDDVAEAVLHALSLPPHVGPAEIVLLPVAQRDG
jgi:NADP-dependent 3-hydroxy acid dehydrogenase YdfG